VVPASTTRCNARLIVTPMRSLLAACYEHIDDYECDLGSIRVEPRCGNTVVIIYPILCILPSVNTEYKTRGQLYNNRPRRELSSSLHIRSICSSRRLHSTIAFESMFETAGGIACYGNICSVSNVRLAGIRNKQQPMSMKATTARLLFIFPMLSVLFTGRPK